MSFSIEQDKQGYRILFSGQVIGQGDVNFGYHILKDVVLREGQEQLISFQQIAPTEFGFVRNAPDVKDENDKVTITLEAENEDGSLKNNCTVVVTHDPEEKTFQWDFTHKLTVIKPYSLKKFFNRTDVDAEYADTGVWIFEITDPMPWKPFAPKDGSIPVDRPDIIFPQPWFKKDGWEKNWRFFAFARPDGRTIRIPMNHLDNHDKDFWRQSADGFMAMLGGKGTNLRFRFLEGTGKNICHHYCMWGYDIHFFEIIAPGSGTGENPPPVLEAGKELYHHYILEALSDEESAEILTGAEDHPWRQRDSRRLSNTPRYNTGVNYFQRGLGRQDNGGLFRTVSSCEFLPEHPGRTEPGVLLIENNNCHFDGTAPYNAWQIGLGPDNWHTPIESGVAYKISVWAKLEAVGDTFTRIAANYLQQFDQATPDFRVESSDTFYSNKISGKTGWQQLVLTTPKLPEGYICVMRISLELHGRGTCYFDEFEFTQG